MQAEPAFQAAEVFWMEMLVSTAFFFFACSRFGQGHLVSGGFRPAAGRDCDDGMPEGVIFECFPVLYSGRIHLVPYLVAALCGKEGKGIGGGY